MQSFIARPCCLNATRQRQPAARPCSQASVVPRPRWTRCKPVMVGAARKDKPESDPRLEESDFDKETARLTLRMLTARAAGIVLQNVAEVDTFKAQWLQEHFKKNPPIEGNAFLAQLLEAKPVYATDPYTGSTYHINPAAIANAVIVTREALAQKLSQNLMPKVQDANIDIMRTHLERHTYVCGSNDDVKPSFRHYRKQQQAKHQQLQ